MSRRRRSPSRNFEPGQLAWLLRSNDCFVWYPTQSGKYDFEKYGAVTGGVPLLIAQKAKREDLGSGWKNVYRSNYRTMEEVISRDGWICMLDGQLVLIEDRFLRIRRTKKHGGTEERQE